MQLADMLDNFTRGMLTVVVCTDPDCAYELTMINRALKAPGRCSWCNSTLRIAQWVDR